MSIQLVQESIV